MNERLLKTIYVKLTNNCNLTCKHCYNSVCTEQGQMSEKTLDKIILYIDDLKEQGYDVEVALHGGEPMLYRDVDSLWNFVFSCNEMNVPITATTNLVYRVTDDHIALFARFKQYDGECLVLTSWDHKIRFKNDAQQEMWEKSVKTILSHDIKVQPIISLTKIFLEEVTPEEIFEYMYNIGVPNLNFERLTCNGRAQDNEDELMPTNKQVDEWFAKAYKLWKTSNKYNFYIPIFDGLEWAVEGKHIGCRARQCSTCVKTFNPDGSMATCPNIPTETISNISKAGSMLAFDEKVNSSKKYKEIINRERTKATECYTCQYYRICNGDCFQLAWDDTGCPGLKNTIIEVLKQRVLEA